MSHPTAPLGTILGVWAHPDDETFLTAGLMAMARAAGQRVVCVTATRGEAGTDDPVRWPPSRLGRLRSVELDAALAALGVHEHHWLGFTDGTCDAVPPELGADTVARIVEQVRPDTVVTFGPDGFTGHPDHRSVSRWARAAVADVAPAARLLHPTVTRDFVTRFGGINEQYSVFDDGLPAVHASDDLALDLHLDDDVLDRKMVALRAQASQISGLHDAVGHETFRAWWGVESFRRAGTVARAALRAA